MIEVTKLNKKKFILNCELIESVEATPDTVIHLRNGKRYIVEEDPKTILKLTIEYKRNLYRGLIAPPQNPDIDVIEEETDKDIK